MFDLHLLGHSPLREGKENDRPDPAVLHSDTTTTYNNINLQSGFKWDGMKTQATESEKHGLWNGNREG